MRNLGDANRRSGAERIISCAANKMIPIRMRGGDDPWDVATECGGLAEIIARIGDTWTVMVVGHLSEGKKRFNELRYSISGISHRMLTVTLRGLVLRRAYATIPPKFEYCLTPLRQSLIGPLALWRNGQVRTASGSRPPARSLILARPRIRLRRGSPSG